MDVDHLSPHEAKGRRTHLPNGYLSIFLIDLTVCGMAPGDADRDLAALSAQTTLVLDGDPVFSSKWWHKYWNGIQYVYQGSIVDSGMYPRGGGGHLVPYDRMARVFKNATVCDRCGVYVPTLERGSGSCRRCHALMNNLSAPRIPMRSGTTTVSARAVSEPPGSAATTAAGLHEIEDGLRGGRAATLSGVDGRRARSRGLTESRILLDFSALRP